MLQRSVTEVPLRWSETVPTRERSDLVLAGDSIARERFVRDAVTYLENFVDPTGREGILGTDVLSTLHDVAEEFKKDPLGIFNSMPTPHKKLLARMANDSTSFGGSESYLVG